METQSFMHACLQMTILLITADLECCKCRVKIDKVLKCLTGTSSDFRGWVYHDSRIDRCSMNDCNGNFKRELVWTAIFSALKAEYAVLDSHFKIL
jgi:hypothetical protein